MLTFSLSLSVSFLHPVLDVNGFSQGSELLHEVWTYKKYLAKKD
jgi:hypothetical protein